MAKREKKVLEKKNWSSSFVLVGEPKINDYTYKLDEHSEKSDWVYNSLNLGIYCGEMSGTVYAELMGGYGAERDNVVYVHGKKEDGSDAFDDRFTVDWEDRFDEDILESVGDMCFLTVGIEKDAKGKVFYKKFLTPYDFIAYVKENLSDDMVVNVKGTLKYSLYQGELQTKKEISSIVLSKIDDPSKYFAKFTQTMLLTKDSIGKPDKDKGVIPITAKVLDYVKMWKNKEVKCNIPYNKGFEYEIDLSDRPLVEKVIDKVFKVKKGVTEITFEGDFVEGGAVVTATEDDIPDDIKTLIELGIYTLDEALTKCSENGGRTRRMVLRKPTIKMVENSDGNKTPVIQKFERKYEEEDLILDFMYADDEPDDDDDIPPMDDAEIIDEEAGTVSDDDWLNNL